MSEDDQKRVYRERERALFEQLENMFEAGVSEITLDGRRYKVKQARGKNWVPFFILEPIEPSSKN